MELNTPRLVQRSRLLILEVAIMVPGGKESVSRLGFGLKEPGAKDSRFGVYC